MRVRSRSRGGEAGVLALILALSATPVAADSSPRPAGPPAAARETLGPPPPASLSGGGGGDAPLSGDDGRRTVRRLPANLGRSVVGVFNKDNLVPLLVGGATTGIASIWDEDVREEVQADDWGESLGTAGGPLWSSVFVAGMFTAGRFSHGTRFRAMTYDMLDASIVNLAYTEVLKVAVGRERPNGQDQKSFPSGHTSNAFALAAVAERHYGWKLGVPAYLVAGLVGASRIQQDKHYLSDVLAGATLGYIVGRTTVRVNSAPIEEKRPLVTVSPILGRDTRGVMVAIVF